MAFQTLTTAITAEETETTTDAGTAERALGTSESSGSLSDGPGPLVPAFILSGLVIFGIVMMCWWKRVSARRAFARSVMGMQGDGMGGGYEEEGRERIGGPRVNMIIGAGRGLSAGMVVLAAHGAELPTQMEVRHDVRRKKEIKLGPRPIMWDVFLEGVNGDGSDGLEGKDVGWRWKWKWMMPLSASHVCQQQHQTPISVQTPPDPPPTVSASPSTTRTRRRNTSARRPSKTQQQQTLSSSPQSQSSTASPPQPPPQSKPQLRVSVLISMPSPRRPSPSSSSSHSGSMRGRACAESSSSSSVDEVEKVEERRRQEDLGDCNLVLGITDVPLDL